MHQHGTHLYAHEPVLVSTACMQRAAGLSVWGGGWAGSRAGRYSGQLPRGLCMGSLFGRSVFLVWRRTGQGCYSSAHACMHACSRFSLLQSSAIGCLVYVPSTQLSCMLGSVQHRVERLVLSFPPSWLCIPALACIFRDAWSLLGSSLPLHL